MKALMCSRRRKSMQRLSLQDREPVFDLVEPGGPRRREVEMTFEPAIVPGLVGVQVVEDDMDGRIRVCGDDVIQYRTHRSCVTLEFTSGWLGRPPHHKMRTRLRRCGVRLSEAPNTYSPNLCRIRTTSSSCRASFSR